MLLKVAVLDELVGHKLQYIYDIFVKPINPCDKDCRDNDRCYNSKI